jgi:hypothetical protein
LIDINELLAILNDKKKIGISLIVGIFLSITYLFIAENQYSSTLSVYPFYEEDSIQNEIATIASTYGFGEKTSNSFYLPDLIFSKSLLSEIVSKNRNELEKKNLIDSWYEDSTSQKIIYNFHNLFLNKDAEKFNVYLKNKAIDKLRSNHIKIIEEYSGLTKIIVLLERPILSYDVANEIHDYINEFYNSNSQNNALLSIEYLKKRLKSIEADIQVSESNLRSFQEDNRSINSSPDLIIQLAGLQNHVAQDYAAYNVLNQQLEMKQLDKVTFKNYLVLIDSPDIAPSPSSPKKLQTIILFIFLVYILLVSKNLFSFLKAKF